MKTASAPREGDFGWYVQVSDLAPQSRIVVKIPVYVYEVTETECCLAHKLTQTPVRKFLLAKNGEIVIPFEKPGKSTRFVNESARLREMVDLILTGEKWRWRIWGGERKRPEEEKETGE